METTQTNQTVKQLRELAKTRGVRGFSMMDKAELITALDGPVPVKESTVKQLRGLAKTRGVRGFLRMNKAELFTALDGSVPGKESIVKQLKEWVKAQLDQIHTETDQTVAQDKVNTGGGDVDIDYNDQITQPAGRRALCDDDEIVSNLNAMKNRQLRWIARCCRVRGWWHMGKAELRSKITEAVNVNSTVTAEHLANLIDGVLSPP